MEAYIEDPIMIAEYTIYLEQNYCLSEIPRFPRNVSVLKFFFFPGDWDDCKQLVVEHFPNMHTMVRFKINS